MRFGILGAVEVTGADGRPVRVGGSRLRALLAMLLLDVNRPVSVDRLVDGLWDARPPADAANALQSLVSRLRAALEPCRQAGSTGRLVESGPGGYRLVADPDTVDAHRFTALATTGRRELAAGDPVAAAATLARALALWRGPALADITEAPYTASAAARLNEARLTATEDHAEAALAAGRHAELVGDLQALAGEHPLRERLGGLLVRALYACGRQADALAAYQRIRQALAEELGMDPSPELRAVHQSVLRQDPTLLAARPTGARSGEPVTNLRAQFTSFVGRDADLTRVGTLLGEARLVTLVGPGGAGKTRLAVESAARLDGSFPGGVWLVELAPAAEPAELPHLVADALGVRQATRFTGHRDTGPVRTTDPTDRLVRALAGRQLLLVLDNCEHLVDAAAGFVERLLCDCPGVRVLATSREPLGITGEMLYPVPPLATPPDRVGATEALDYPAVRLFVDRGVAARPDFTVHTGNVAAVARVCRRLDGMPLAIELAAARLRVLPVDQVAARLDDRFGLLTSGSRTALPRHRTLRAVVEWSWDLLDDRERVLARRLSAFSAGATLDAAERVCAGEGLAADEVFDVLAGLVDRSLVEADTADRSTDRCGSAGQVADSVPRYRMLETVRAYAAERLVASGEQQRTREAHARYFLDLAETADPGLRGHHQLDWIGRLVAEQDNLHATLRWAVETPDPEIAVRMVSALTWYWVLRGHHAEAVDWARQVVTAVGDEPPTGRLADYVGCLLGASIDPADPGTLVPVVDRGLRMLAEAGEPEPRRPLFLLLRLLTALLGDQPGSPGALLDTWLVDPDPWIRAFARSARGAVRLNQGEPEAAVEDLEVGLAGHRSVGDRWGMCQCLTHLAELAGYQGDNPRAVALMDEAGRCAGELGATAELPELVLRRSMVRSRTGDLTGARADMAEARRWADRLPQPHLRALVLLAEGELAWQAGRMNEAEERYDQARQVTPAEGGEPQARALAGCAVARCALARGEVLRARELVAAALAVPRLLIDRPVTASVLETLAAVELAGGDPGRAALLLGAAEATRGMPDLGNPHTRVVVAAVRRALGEPAYDRARRRGAALDRGEFFDLVGVSGDQVTPSRGRPVPPAARTPR